MTICSKTENCKSSGVVSQLDFLFHNQLYTTYTLAAEGQDSILRMIWFVVNSSLVNRFDCRNFSPGHVDRVALSARLNRTVCSMPKMFLDSIWTPVCIVMYQRRQVAYATTMIKDNDSDKRWHNIIIYNGDY